MLNTIMDPIVWLAVLLPVAFLHGHYVGKKKGIQFGASRMFEEIWKNGTPTSKRGVRTIELENE